MPQIKYELNALSIRIETNDPASMHEELLKSITTAIQYCSQLNPKPKNYPEEIICLFELMKALIPSESALVKAYA